MKEQKSAIREYTLFFIGMICIAIFSFWKCRYGLGNNDEPFYLTIPYRMNQGDKLFFHEWHVSQAAAFFLFPLMKIYLLIFKNTVGIIIHFRYIYICVNAVVTVFAYRRLKKYGLSAGVVCMLYFLFVPFNIMALSYNSIGLASDFLCTVFLLTANEKKKTDYIIAGIFFAMMVLCQPILSLIFCIEAAVSMIYGTVKKKKTMIQKILYFFAGCVIAAIPVVMYLVIKVGVTNVLAVIPQILNDPEHTGAGGIRNLCHNIVRLYIPEKQIIIGKLSFDVKEILKMLYCLFGVIWISAIIDRKMRRKVKIAISAMLSIGISSCYLIFIQNSYINFLLFPWVLHSITMFLMETDKNVRKKIGLVWIIGFSHAAAFLGSNQYGYVFNIAFIPTSLINILLSLHEKESRKITEICVVVTFIFLSYARIEHVFWQTPPQTLTEQCSDGSVKGLYVSEKTKEFYEKQIEDIRKKNIDKNDKILFLTNNTFLPLEVKGSIAQYSCWLSGVNENTFKRLETYYTMIPEKIPNKVYIGKEYVDKQTIIEWAEQNGFHIEESEISYFLEKDI